MSEPMRSSDVGAKPPPANAPSSAEDEARQLQQQLDELRASWTWRLGRLFTKPFDLFARAAPLSRERARAARRDPGAG